MDLPPDSGRVQDTGEPASEVEWAHQDWWRSSDLPAVNGHDNARSSARVQSAFATGGSVNGVRLLSPDNWKRVREEQASGRDLVPGSDVTFGLGYGLSSTGLPLGAAPEAFFWGGFGGSLVIDPQARTTFALAVNKMRMGTLGDDRTGSMLAAGYYVVAATRPIRR